MIYGNNICTFPKCHRTAIAHIQIAHPFESGPPIIAWEALCQGHLDAVQAETHAEALEIVKALSAE